MTLTVGSLFSGIGGLDLGLERAGMEVRWQSEIDPYCSRVLAKHWPDVPNLGDVTKVDWNDVERVDLICGGFPCQPQSYAGKRLGNLDERWLWPEFARCLRVLRPRFVLLENVPGLLTLGFGEVAGDLAELGYDFEWDCIPAAAVGAPHLRFRVFLVAHADGRGLEERSEPDGGAREPGRWAPFGNDARRLRPHVADANGERLEGLGRAGLREAQREFVASDGGTIPDADQERRGWRAGVFGPSGWRQLADCGQWPAEPPVRRVAYGVPSRVDRLRALGNAVVPQVAEFVGSQLLAGVTRGTP